MEQLPLESARPPVKRALGNLGAETHDFRSSIALFGFLVENGMRMDDEQCDECVSVTIRDDEVEKSMLCVTNSWGLDEFTERG